MLAGVFEPDSGKIFINDELKNFSNPRHAFDAGISMLYQELDLAEDLTVYENIYLGREIKSNVPYVINRKAEIAGTEELCRQYGFDIDPTTKIREMSIGDCQIVELLKALMRK
jgi:ABC-type uncharacterized transport system ATPase subunit